NSSSGYNPAYPSFSNDCTNFVSQALAAGGWPQISSSYYTLYNVWFMDAVRGLWSYTWTVASYFQQFPISVSHVRGTYVSYFTQLVAGDVMLVDWHSQYGYPTH